MSESRKPWTAKEDEAIKTLVKKYGVKRWADVSQQIQSKYKIYGRTGKQCRERWHNHLNPEISKKPWSPQQERIIFEAHRKYGNQWTAIAKLLQGRTDNAIKNYFYSTLRKSLRRINRILGSRDSSTVMKAIKPSVLSQIFYYSGLSVDEVNASNRQLVQDCKNLSESLLQFTTNGQTDLSHKNDNNKQKLDDLIERLLKFNENYEKMAKDQKRKKARKQSFKEQMDVQPEEVKSQRVLRKRDKKPEESTQVKQQNMAKQQPNQATISIENTKKDSSRLSSQLKRIESGDFFKQQSQVPFLDFPQFSRLRSQSSRLSRDSGKGQSRDSKGTLQRKQSQLSDNYNMPILMEIPSDCIGNDGSRRFQYNTSPSLQALMLRTPKYPTPNTSGGLGFPELNFKKDSSFQYDKKLDEIRTLIKRNNQIRQ